MSRALAYHPTAQYHDKVPVTEIHLSPDDSGRCIGPLPVGDYAASLMAAAVKPERNSVPVSIANDVTNALSFTFRPAGMVYGHVVVRRSAEDRPAGMPAEQYLASDRPIVIQKVTLKGAGVERVVRPVEDRTLDAYERFISSTDFCTRDISTFSACLPAIMKSGLLPKDLSRRQRPMSSNPAGREMSGPSN